MGRGYNNETIAVTGSSYVAIVLVPVLAGGSRSDFCTRYM